MSTKVKESVFNAFYDVRAFVRKVFNLQTDDKFPRDADAEIFRASTGDARVTRTHDFMHI